MATKGKGKGTKVFNGTYSTVYAGQQADQVQSLAKKAKAKAKASEERMQNMQNRYGTAMSGVANQAWQPLLARTKAMTMAARARVAEAEAAQQAARQSNRINAAVGPAMQAGQAGVLSRVRESAEPAFISAQQAISDANAYYKKVGIDLKTASWEAKAALYGQFLTDQNQFAMMQYQSDLEIEQQKELARFNQRMLDDPMKKEAPRVANSAINNAASAYQFVNDMDEDEARKPVEAATEWANTHIANAAERQFWIETMTPIIENRSRFMGDNGYYDIGQFRALFSAQINHLYPQFEGDLDSLLSEAVLIGAVSTAAPVIDVPGVPSQRNFRGGNTQTYGP